MKTNINIKNFRVFNEDGVMFEFNPITILTGSNSSGKSSAVKALFLLNSFLSQIKKAVDNNDPIQLDKYKLDFTQYPNNLLGRLDKVIHSGSNDRTITIEYTVYSLMLSKEVNIQLVFSADENDELNNAFLESITMCTEEGIFFSSKKSIETWCNLNIIQSEYASFLLAEYAIHLYYNLQSSYEFEDNISEKELKTKKDEVNHYLDGVENSRIDDIKHYIRVSKRNHPIISNSEEAAAIEYAETFEYLFVLPLVQKLDEMEKEEVEEYISEYLDDAGKGLKSASEKVINAFMESNFDSFYEFFVDFEYHHFEHVSCVGGPFHQTSKKVHLLSANELELKQDYLLFCPFDWETVRVFSDESNRTQHVDKQKENEEWESRPLTFDMLYEVVVEWNRRIPHDDNDHIIEEESSMINPYGKVSPIAYQLFIKFAEALVQEVVYPDWGGNMSYVSSSRANVDRLYTLDGKDDFSILLQNYFEKKRLYLDYQKNNNNIDKRDYEIDSFMNRWVEKFGIGKAIILSVDKEGLGVQIRLQKVHDFEGRLLADEGYGITQLVSILLQIETAILSAKGEKVNHYFGMESFDNYDFNKFHYEINTIAIEEPEIHLHPKYQSLLADMFVEAYKMYNIHFVIETHSEYLIRKLQLLASNKNKDMKVDRADVSLYYVNSVDDKSQQKVKRIGICSDGYLDDTFGEGFYDEATRLSRQLM